MENKCNFMRIFGWIVVGIVGWFVLWGVGIVLGVFSLPFHAASNIVNTGSGVIDKTLNADNAIYNYEWFKQQKQDIDVAKGQYSNAVQALDSFEASAGVRSSWTFEDKQEDARLRSVALGLQNQIIQRVNDYNARASMANRDIFKDGLLPNVLEFSANILK